MYIQLRLGVCLYATFFASLSLAAEPDFDVKALEETSLCVKELNHHIKPVGSILGAAALDFSHCKAPLSSPFSFQEITRLEKDTVETLQGVRPKIEASNIGGVQIKKFARLDESSADMLGSVRPKMVMFQATAFADIKVQSLHRTMLGADDI